MVDRESQFDEYINLVDSYPWERLLDVCGRATGLESALRSLPSSTDDEFIAAVDYIHEHVEHQDWIIQATPFAVKCMLALLPLAENSKRREMLQSIIDHVHESARFGLAEASTGRDYRMTIDQLLDDAKLAPPYVDEATEDEMWETAGEWAQSDEVYQVTLNLIERP